VVRELEVAGLEGYGADHGRLGRWVGDLVGGEGGSDRRQCFLGRPAFERVCCAGAGVGGWGDGEEGGSGERVGAGIKVVQIRRW